MPVSNDFLEYVLDQLSNWNGVYTKKMFGGVGLYYEGLMFGLVYNDIVAFKINETNKEKYIKAGSDSIKIFKNKTPLPSFYIVPITVFENANDFIFWARESYAIQVSKKR